MKLMSIPDAVNYVRGFDRRHDGRGFGLHGVFYIRCKATGLGYVGSSDSVEACLKSYCYRKKKPSQWGLSASLNTYGPEEHECGIIYLHPPHPLENGASRDLLARRLVRAIEQRYLHKWDLRNPQKGLNVSSVHWRNGNAVGRSGKEGSMPPQAEGNPNSKPS